MKVGNTTRPEIMPIKQGPVELGTKFSVCIYFKITWKDNNEENIEGENKILKVNLFFKE